jgi:hypothetical protein
VIEEEGARAMRVVPVNVSLSKLVEFRGRAVPTSIFKEPMAGL